MRFFKLHFAIPWSHERERRADYIATFASPVGRRVLQDILRNNYVTNPVIPLDSAGRLDEKKLLIAEGRRSLALDLARMSNEDLFAVEQYEQKRQELEEANG